MIAMLLVPSSPARPLARALALLAATTLLACSSNAATEVAGDAAGADATGHGDGASDGGGDDADVGTLADTGDDGPVFVIDATPPDTAACTQLNIAIFGNPGSNASANFQQWLQKSGTSVQRIQTTTAVPLTADLLKPFDVVVLDWLTRDYSATEAAAFATWVSAGGGVASMTGYDNNTTDDWHANSLLSQLGVAYAGPLRSGPVTDFMTHPITAGLTSVTFSGGYAINDLGGTATTRTPIAFLADGSGGKVNAGIAIQRGAGRAFVWGDEWIEFDSEWSTLPAIKQLWVQVFRWVSPTNKCTLVPPS
jgi:hypothetical protein